MPLCNSYCICNAAQHHLIRVHFYRTKKETTHSSLPHQTLIWCLWIISSGHTHYNLVCGPLCLVSFTWHKILNVHLCWRTNQYFLLWHDWTVLYCMNIPHLFRLISIYMFPSTVNKLYNIHACTFVWISVYGYSGYLPKSFTSNCTILHS